MRKISLQEVQDLKKRLKVKQVVKECIGDVFHINGKDCCWAGDTGKPNMLVDGEWIEYDTLEALKKAERQREFENTVLSIDKVDLTQLFEKLVFLGPKGLDILTQKLPVLKDELLKGATPQVNSGLSFSVWSDRGDEQPQNCVQIGDKLYQTDQDILNCLHDDVITQRAASSILDIASLIPVGEVWNGSCIYNTFDKQHEDINGNLIIETPECSYEVPNTSKGPFVDSVVGLVFNSKTIDNKVDYDIDATTIDWPTGYCVLNTTLQVENESLSDLHVRLASFEALQKDLRADEVYTKLVDNLAFQKAVQELLNNQTDSEINVNQFMSNLNVFIARECDNLDSTDFSKAFKIILHDPIVEKYKNSCQELSDYLVNNTDTFIKIISTYNVLFNISKDFNWIKTKLSESKKSDFIKLQSKDGFVRLCYKS